jgi:ribose transport system substrate-binding protein
MRKLFSAILLIVIVSMLAACATGGETVPTEEPDEITAPTEEPAEKYVIGISYQGPNNDWAINFKAHFEMTMQQEYADKIEEVIYKEYGWEGEQQIADVEDLMTMGIDILILAPHSDTGMDTTIESVKAAGIPVVVYNTAPGTDQYDALIMSDNIADGRDKAEWMAEELNEQGNILIIGGAPGSAYAEDMIEGYDQVLAGYPEMTVLGYEYAYWTPATAKQIVESYIAKGDQIDGIITSGLMGLGCLEAFTDAGMPIPPMTSGDGWTGFLRKAKELGYTDFGGLPTNNFIYAVGVIHLAFDVLEGNPVEKVTLVPPNEAMEAQAMLDMLTDDMPASYWIGGLVPVEDFNKYAGIE